MREVLKERKEFEEEKERVFIAVREGVLELNWHKRKKEETHRPRSRKQAICSQVCASARGLESDRCENLL